jgi:hypothetical protein
LEIANVKTEQECINQFQLNSPHAASPSQEVVLRMTQKHEKFPRFVGNKKILLYKEYPCDHVKVQK